MRFARNKFIFCVVLGFLLCHPRILRAQNVVIVSTKSPTDSLSILQLQKIFKGQAPGALTRTPYQVVEFSSSSDEFYKNLYGLSAYTIGKHWLRLIFAGERVLPPKSFADVNELVNFVSSNANAIGFLPANIFRNLNNHSIHAVVINGQNYNNPNYSLNGTKR